MSDYTLQLQSVVPIHTPRNHAFMQRRRAIIKLLVLARYCDQEDCPELAQQFRDMALAAEEGRDEDHS